MRRRAQGFHRFEHRVQATTTNNVSSGRKLKIALILGVATIPNQPDSNMVRNDAKPDKEEASKKSPEADTAAGGGGGGDKENVDDSAFEVGNYK